MDNGILLDYFKSLMDRQGKYHDHKEVSAWAGVVLYFVFCGAILRTELMLKCPLLGFLFISLAALGGAISATLYVRNQLRLKDIAGSQTAAAIYYMSVIITNGQLTEAMTAIPQSADAQVQSSHVLPASFLEKASWLNTQGRRAQDRTRLFAYVLMWIMFLFLVLYEAAYYFC